MFSHLQESSTSFPVGRRRHHSWPIFLPSLLCFLLIFSDIFPTPNSIPFGRRRRRRNELDEAEEGGGIASLEANNCHALCDAQFARDFEEEFGRSYLTRFFDFPIDPLLTSSASNFHRFCQLVGDRSCCLRRECLFDSIPASPQTYICLEHKSQFEKALKCLNSTNAHFKFHAVCSNAAKRSIDLDRELAESRGFSEADAEQYHQQDLRCRFQACTLQARMLLINEYCSADEDGNEREESRQTVLNYYLEDLELDLAEFGEQLNATKHFPRFCAQFLAQQRAVNIAFLENNEALGEFERELQILLEAIGAVDRKRRAKNEKVDSEGKRNRSSETMEMDTT